MRGLFKPRDVVVVLTAASGLCAMGLVMGGFASGHAVTPIGRARPTDSFLSPPRGADLTLTTAAPSLRVSDVLSELSVEADRKSVNPAFSPLQVEPPRLARREVETLARRCAPATPVNVITSIVAAESGGRPLALLQNGRPARRFSPKSLAAAAQQLARLQAANASVDVGLMQINTATLRRLHVAAEAALDSCTNIRLGAQVFDGAYALAFARRARTLPLLSAYSAYNTGDLERGVANGYADHAIDHLRSITRSPAAG